LRIRYVSTVEHFFLLNKLSSLDSLLYQNISPVTHFYIFVYMICFDNFFNIYNFDVYQINIVICVSEKSFDLRNYRITKKNSYAKIKFNIRRFKEEEKFEKNDLSRNIEYSSVRIIFWYVAIATTVRIRRVHYKSSSYPRWSLHIKNMYLAFSGLFYHDPRLIRIREEQLDTCYLCEYT